MVYLYVQWSENVSFISNIINQGYISTLICIVWLSPFLTFQRTYYISYPISGYDSTYTTTVSLPSRYNWPRLYRWYYSWPRQYSYYSSNWPYWPYYRTYLSDFLKSYYLNSYWPYSYYWSSYLPYYKSLDYEFSELENKIDNLRVSTVWSNL